MIETVQGIPPLVIASVEAAQLDIGEETRAASQNALEQASNEPNNLEEQSQEPGEGGSGASSASDTSNKPPGPDFSQISQRLQELLSNDTMVQFSIDEITKKIVLKIINTSTEEVIRQIPAEESLKIAQFLTNRFEQGNVTDAKV